MEYRLVIQINLMNEYQYRMVKKTEFTYDDLRKIILKKAKNIHTLSVEHGYTIECDGEIYSYNDNDDGEINIPIQKIKLAVIILHNHPHEFKEPSTFSGADVYNLLYYKPQEIVLCSYGMCFTMKDTGCTLLPSEVMHVLDKKYKEITNQLFNKYISNQNNTPREMRENYKRFKVELEQEYRAFLRTYSKKVNLLYTEEKL